MIWFCYVRGFAPKSSNDARKTHTTNKIVRPTSIMIFATKEALGLPSPGASPMVLGTLNSRG
jgi:hypothetical protein